MVSWKTDAAAFNDSWQRGLHRLRIYSTVFLLSLIAIALYPRYLLVAFSPRNRCRGCAGDHLLSRPRAPVTGVLNVIAQIYKRGYQEHFSSSTGSGERFLNFRHCALCEVGWNHQVNSGVGADICYGIIPFIDLGEVIHSRLESQLSLSRCAVLRLTWA